MNRLNALGVITNKQIPNKDNIDVLFKELTEAFDKDSVTKEEVVEILQKYLPNFQHIETGKSLDSKM